MKQNSPIVNKLKHPVGDRELDLCADLSQQLKSIENYKKHLNSYCNNCKTEPCRCHLIPMYI